MLEWVLGKVIKKTDNESVIKNVLKNPDDFVYEGKVVDGKIVIQIRKSEETDKCMD